MIRVELPAHLRTLARLKGSEIQLDVAGPVTPAAILDAIEARFPMLVGTMRDHVTLKRRPLVRFFEEAIEAVERIDIDKICRHIHDHL